MDDSSLFFYKNQFLFDCMYFTRVFRLFRQLFSPPPYLVFTYTALELHVLIVTLYLYKFSRTEMNNFHMLHMSQSSRN